MTREEIFTALRELKQTRIALHDIYMQTNATIDLMEAGYMDLLSHADATNEVMK